MSSSLCALVLAAGASKRMPGKIKQLLPWGHTTLMGNAIEAVVPVVDRVHVVLGAHAEILASHLPGSVRASINPKWEEGMGTSLAFGIGQILETEKNPDGLLIVLSDQPFMDTSYFKSLKKIYDERKAIKIVATQYATGRFGVPAIFDASFFPELKKLNKDFGAKRIIRSNLKATYFLEPRGKEIDIDTFDMYQKLYNKIK